MFTPTIPPIAPIIIDINAITKDVLLSKKPFSILDIAYKTTIYISPLSVPCTIPFFLIFNVLIELPHQYANSCNTYYNSRYGTF